MIIASDYTDRQLRAVRRIQGIELLCYRRYGDTGFALEWVHGGEEETATPIPIPEPPGPDSDFSINEEWQRTSEEIRALFRQFQAYVETLGGDVRLDVFKTQFTFRRKRGNLKWPPVFALGGFRKEYISVNVHERKQSTPVESGFTRVGTDTYYREIRIRNLADLEKAKPLLREAYERT